MKVTMVGSGSVVVNLIELIGGSLNILTNYSVSYNKRGPKESFVRDRINLLTNFISWEGGCVWVVTSTYWQPL